MTNCGLGDLLRTAGFLNSRGFLTATCALITVALPVRWLSNQSGALRDVYVVAHQDDWQLFMGDVAAENLRSKPQSRFVYLTAGDEGRDSTYWETRERAALASTHVAAGLVGRSDSNSCAAIVVRQHEIRRCSVGNTDSFFLRLPDGRRNGAGFSRYHNQSMRRLLARKITAITAVDGSATYQGWDDLVSTVGELVDDTSDLTALVHTTDPSVAVNPHDHFDHRMAGLLIAELRKRENLAVRYYVGYALATRADNRSNEQARVKTAIFLAYDQEMMRVNKNWSAYREHPAFYSECMLRTYVRTLRAR